MDAIRQLCNKSILLNHGKLVHAGSTSEVLNTYVENIFTEKETSWKASNRRTDRPFFESVSIELQGAQPDLQLLLTATIQAPLGNYKKSNIAIDIKNGSGATIMQAIPDINPFIEFNGNSITVKTRIYLSGLVPDRYFVSVWVGPHNTETFDWVHDVVSFEVLHTPTPGRVFPHTPDHGSIVPRSEIIDFQ
jgi:hypothetical protein